MLTKKACKILSSRIEDIYAIIIFLTFPESYYLLFFLKKEIFRNKSNPLTINIISYYTYVKYVSLILLPNTNSTFNKQYNHLYM
jgi:hypothetical protein